MSGGCEQESEKLLRVGELAKRAGKSVRALHLYEELGLLRPVARSTGGFRLFRPSAVDRIAWICKLQAIGFSLSDIRAVVRDFERCGSARAATAEVRRVFADKLGEIRDTISRLRAIESDLSASLDYLESCRGCEPSLPPDECHECDHQDHEVGDAPELFAGLSEMVVEELEAAGYDVSAAKLTREPGGAG